MPSPLEAVPGSAGRVPQALPTTNPPQEVSDPVLKRLQVVEKENEALIKQANEFVSERAGFRREIDDLTAKLKVADEKLIRLARGLQAAQKTQSVADKLILRKRAKLSTCFRECMKACGGSEAIPIKVVAPVAFVAALFSDERLWVKAGAVLAVGGAYAYNWWTSSTADHSSAVRPHLEEAREICQELEIPWRPLDRDPSPPEGKEFFAAWKAIRAKNPALDEFFVNAPLPAELTSNGSPTPTPTAAPRSA